MARKQSDRLVCRHCKAPITGAEVRKAVWLGIGPLHAVCHREVVAKVAAGVERAVREGTHSTGPRMSVCGQCREWVTSLWHRTLDGRMLCPGCSPDGPKVPGTKNSKSVK